MFGTYFYHQRIRNSVALFGRLFSDIYVMRKNGDNDGISTVKVPLSYAPRRKYIERLLENPDLTKDTQVAIKLPRMSFEITNIAYDAARQLAKTSNFNKVGSNVNQRAKFYAPIPYNIDFQLNIYAKTQDDALQIVEQIIPYFSPQYSITIKPLANYPDIKDDIPITIQSITFTDDYEGAMEARRTIIYTLDFEMKINFYGPTAESKIIRTVDADLYQIQTGLVDSDVFVEKIRVEPDPINVSPDSDYGFTTTIFTALDSA